MMMEKKRVLEKLLFIQQELKAPKGQYNSFGKYKYRSCEDILEAVKPLCVKHDAALTITDELVLIGDRFYVAAHARLYDCETGDFHEVQAFAREPDDKKGMDSSQVTGTASSYARKYALNGLFCIDDTKDADTDEYKAQTEKAVKKPTNAEMDAFSKQYREQVDRYTCKDCGSLIEPREHNGKLYTVEQISAGAVKKFKVPLCWDCMNKRKANASAAT